MSGRMVVVATLRCGSSGWREVVDAFVNKELLLHTCAYLWMKGLSCRRFGLAADHDGGHGGKKICGKSMTMGDQRTARESGRRLCWQRGPLGCGVDISTLANGWR
jgi:hypothetical protein